jgi:hypothetical protein
MSNKEVQLTPNPKILQNITMEAGGCLTGEIVREMPVSIKGITIVL